MASNPNTPWGLQPYQRKGSADYRANAHMYYIANGNSNAFYVGDPVKRIATPASANGVPTVTLASAGTSNLITGVIVGIVGYGTSTPSAPVGSFFANSGTPGPAYIPASNSTGAYVMVDDDPNSLFVVQADDSGGTQAVTTVGKNANLASGTGSKYTGWSGWKLASSTAGTQSTKQVVIVDFEQEVDNVAGNANAKFIVRINQSTEGLASTGI